MMKKTVGLIFNSNTIVNLQRYAAFCVSLYLTMDMFVLMVAGDPVREWAFRIIAFVFESNKIMILKKSFVYKHASARLLAIALMTVSVGMAAMSATQAAGTGHSTTRYSASIIEASINDKIAQRDELLKKIQGLPPEWRTSSIEYQSQASILQSEIDAARLELVTLNTSAVAAGGVFESIGQWLNLTPEAIRFAMFFLLIVLIEAILYAETYYSTLAPENLYTKEEIEEAVRAAATQTKTRLAAESHELF
jgi:hypothetical protein